MRKHEAIADKKIEESKLTHDEMARAVAKDLPAGQTYAVKKGEGADLLGFGFVKDEEEFETRRGGRGGRGGDRPQTTAQRGGRPAGGRKGGKLVVDDNDFPAL